MFAEYGHLGTEYGHLGTERVQRGRRTDCFAMVHARDQIVCAQCDEAFRLSDVALTLASRPSNAWHCMSCSEARARCSHVQKTALVTVDWEHYGVFQGEVHGVMQIDSAKHHLVWYKDDNDSEWHDLERHGGVEFISLSDVASPTPGCRTVCRARP